MATKAENDRQESAITIATDMISVVVNPALGGAVTRFAARLKNGKAFDVMRKASAKAGSANDAAMFPLVPYSNRIRGGSFVYWGIRHPVPKNFAPVDDPIHGDGWIASWRVDRKTASDVQLSYKHSGKDGFPFPYKSTLTYAVKDNKLTVGIAVTNAGDFPMPCGLGLHPFFTRTPAMRLKLRNRQVWAHELIPVKAQVYRTPADWSFEAGREIGNLELDTCFGGFDGAAEISWPGEKVKLDLTAKDCSHVVIFTPAKKDYLCVEPVTNANDAFNLAAAGIAGTGIKSVDEGETFKIEATFAVTAG